LFRFHIGFGSGCGGGSGRRRPALDMPMRIFQFGFCPADDANIIRAMAGGFR